MITTFAEAEKLAENHLVIPIVKTLFSGTETPVGLFEKLCGGQPGTFLLESAEHGVWSRYSFIGINSRGVLSKSNDGHAVWTSEHDALPNGGAIPNSALGALDAMVRAWTTPPIEGLPPLSSGLVGMIGWEAIREIEKLPDPPKSDYDVPVLWFSMFKELVVVDHQESTLKIVVNLFSADSLTLEDAYSDALTRISRIERVISQPNTAFIAEAKPLTALELFSNQTKPEFLAAVEKAKEYVRKGDVFQVVLSQRFDQTVSASPLDVYRALRALNPSPYMYLLNQADAAGNYSIVGSSPEALVKVNDSHAVMHPIAGSRPRGATTEQDIAAEQNLIADAKERAEHLMLVDLARNDLLKVCKPDSIAVTEFMSVHRFSHIMHLVSTVEGDLNASTSAVDVFKATFPAGTLSGAPKPRALEIIDELEPSNRGLFGGVIGYFDFAGAADLAIAIRTAFVRDDVARIQAGAGIVLDSDPVCEYEETRTKASAPARAVATANGFHEAL